MTPAAPPASFGRPAPRTVFAEFLVMTWSLRVGRVAGTELRIHLTFLLLLAWIGIGYYAGGGFRAAVSGVAFILLIFACVVLHEFGHALAARRYGIPTPSITLYPIG